MDHGVAFETPPLDKIPHLISLFMIPCPCCAQPMVNHVHRSRVYWFCPHCHQEMPDLVNVMMTKRQHDRAQAEARCLSTLTLSPSPPEENNLDYAMP